MDTLLESLNKALRSALVPDPPPPEVLTDLENKLDQLGQVSVAWGGNGIDEWLARFRSLFTDVAIRDSLLVRVLQLRLPRLAEALTITGVFTIEYSATGVHAFHIDTARLEGFLKNPGPTASDLDYWLSKIQTIADVKLVQVYLSMLALAPIDLIGLEYTRRGFAALPSPPAPDLTLQDLTDLVDSPLLSRLPVTPPLDLQAFKDNVNNALTTDYLALIGPDTFDPLHPLDGSGIELKLADPQGLFAGKTLDLGNGWRASFATKADSSGIYRILVKGEGIDPDPNAGSNADAEIRISRGGAGAILIGPADGPHAEIGDVALGLSVTSSLDAPDEPRFRMTVSLDRVALVLTADVLGPIGSVFPIPGEIRFATDASLAYLQGVGLPSLGGADPPIGAEYMVPVNLDVGAGGAGFSINAVRVRVELRVVERSVRVSMRFGAAGQLGPVRLMIEDAGGWFGKQGSAWSGLEPPGGVGLSLDAGPVSGGGMLKKLSELEYGGALQLKILGIGAFAYGIVGTLPGGGATFVALIGIRFPPPGIQLGFGFAISGLGGLIGINRRADTDLLRERLASGAAGNVLFNDNPMASAPMLLTEMSRFFPGEAGVFIVGPTLQINWLSLLRLDVGVFVELPGPRKLFIAGSARMVIGASEELALIYLRLDFIGGIDFTKQLIFFDASLVNSHLIHIFKLTGGVALRIAYGSNGYFLFSAGGFHPSFNPGPLELPQLARVGSTMSLDVAIANVWLKQQFYVALTSNTFQLGARTEAGIKIGPISAHGWFGFDALVQFDPFHFVATIDAGFDVEVAGVSLCSVNVRGQLSGPGPLVLEARASVRILFVRISANVTIPLGGTPTAQPVPIPDVLGRVFPEIARPENLRAEGEDRSVVFRALEPLPLPIVSPIGSLIWEQRRVPFGLDIQRLEGAPLDGTHRISVDADGLDDDPEYDWFGVGTYRTLSDAEALNNARVTQEQSGVRVGKGGFSHPTAVTHEITIDLVLLPARLRLLDLVVDPYLASGFLAMQAEADRTPAIEGGPPLVTIVREAWDVADSQTGQLDGVETSPIQSFFTAQGTGKVAVATTGEAVELTGIFS
jgi:hypothetical protein